MKKAAFLFHLTEQRRARIGGEDVEGGGFQPVGLDPFERVRKDVGAIVVEAEEEAAIHLDAVGVEEAHAAGVVLGRRRALARVGQVPVAERLQTDENARAAGQSHLADDGRIVGDVDGNGGRPDHLQRPKSAAKAHEVVGIRAKIVVGEDGVRLAIAADLINDLLGIAHLIRLMQPLGGEVAEPAAVVAAASGNDAGGGEEAVARHQVAARRRAVAIGFAIIAEVGLLERAGLDVAKDLRPELDSLADGQRIGVGRGLFGAGEDVESAEDDDGAAIAIPPGQLIGAVGEGEMDADADNLGEAVARRGTLEEVLIPDADVPIRRRGAGDAGEGEGGSEDVLAEAGVGGPWGRTG